MLNPKDVLPGNEQYEFFNTRKGKRVQYDYRHIDGRLFSTVALSLDIARQRRIEWMADNILERLDNIETRLNELKKRVVKNV